MFVANQLRDTPIHSAGAGWQRKHLMNGDDITNEWQQDVCCGSPIQLQLNTQQADGWFCTIIPMNESISGEHERALTQHLSMDKDNEHARLDG